MRRLHRFTVPAFCVSLIAVSLGTLGTPAAYERADTAVGAARGEVGTIVLAPRDTFLNTNSQNYSTSTTLPTYTWPDNQVANTILMKFDLSALPVGAVVTEATLHLALVESDAAADTTYTVSAHKVIGKNPVIGKATGYTADGAIAWTANNCCYNAVPLAQADLSPAYDAQAIDQVYGFKTWTITTMVQEWRLNSALNYGLALNSDASKPRDRFRTFASVEHANASLRPFLKITFVASDAEPPSVVLTTPQGGDASGMVALAATATDNVGVAGVQFHVNGKAACAEQTASPYVFNWDSTTQSDGVYALSAVARDTSGNVKASSPVSVTVKNGILVLPAQDTTLNVNANNYSADPLLMSYTWPDKQAANAILMKFDLSSIPPNGVIEDAKVFLALIESDALPEATYSIAASKILNRNPVISLATGYTADGVTSWTPNGCCYGGVPLAQADISAPYDTVAVDKAPGFKSWMVTAMVREWLTDPLTNFGLLLGSDTSKTSDHYRFFASTENLNASLRPYLRVRYSLTADVTPPVVAITTPAGELSQVASIVATASDNVGVAGVQLRLNGVPLGAELSAPPYTFNWDTRTVDNGEYDLTATARDAAGNSTLSPPGRVKVNNDKIPPLITGVTVSGVTKNAATISWTTDEAGDTQAEYGKTTAYGTLSSLGTAASTTHSVALSGLTHTTKYHFRVRSRDQASNLATSADFTFTTLDGGAPTVSISSPAAAATVSGTITVSANANDNVGVVGVQFKLDGAKLGAESTASPYSVPWDTTTVADGSHTLTAVARDAAGNVKTSTAVVVTVKNDSTPPAIAAVSAADITANGATISWTTSEPADSRVEYGITTAYGNATALSAALVTAHSASLAGLSGGTLYHYRVVSRDAAGNLATSPDFTLITIDGTAPAVSVTAPAAGATVSGSISVAANASDNLGVAGVQFKLDGANLGAEDIVAPYAVTWDTTSVASGAHTLTAVARDLIGNTAVSAPVTVTVNAGALVLSPADTWLNINAENHNADPQLMTYTWPANQMANVILMKFDVSSLPAKAVVQDAKLFLALTQSDAQAAATYRIAASKVLTRNPVISQATGYMADGTTAWTPNACCYDNVPLAQADISAAYDTIDVDKVPGFKSWNITTMLQEWVADPSANFGVVLGADPSKGADHYRYFASMENADPSLRPYLQVLYTLSDDATPPAISGVAATGVTKNTATISWTTNEAANSQVEYGLTTAYGNFSTLDGALVTTHSTVLSGLSDGKQYHYRVRSRDQAGNLAISADATFTTPDGTAPTVSVTAPTGGTTVSGTISVTANASDNVGVAGVQFQLDGANYGAEDTAAPYSTSWNTSGVPDGNHTLTAVARDAAGNVKNSTAVIVNVSNTAPPPPPAGAGISANYPGDVGIENDTNVVFVERFDESTLANLFSRWSDVKNGSAMSFSADVPAGSPVGKSLTIPWSAGNDGGHLYRRLPQGVDDTLYVRYYVKYPTNNDFNHSGVWMGGHNPPQDWPNPQAGVKPSGSDRFIAAAEHNTMTDRFDHYDYWMRMRAAG
ncbi:MAG TPA: Ig-like domain-containing protein, partial [Vicinamibacterales bacterium]|nr:Ig-like domain-containing protein [Vicinamibacterales bacterium]